MKKHVEFYHSKQKESLKIVSRKATGIASMILGFIVGALVMVFVL